MTSEAVLENLMRIAYLRVFRLAAYAYPAALLYYCSWVPDSTRMAFLAVRLPLAWLLFQTGSSTGIKLVQLRLRLLGIMIYLMFSNTWSLSLGAPQLLDVLAHVSIMLLGFLEVQQVWAFFLNAQIALCWLLCQHWWLHQEPAVRVQLPLLLTLGLSHYLVASRRKNLNWLARLLVQQGGLNARRQRAVQMVLDCNALLDLRVETRRQELNLAQQRLRQVYADLQVTQAERRELQDRFSQSQRLAALARFAQGLSHSFSNTVTCIWGSLPELSKMDAESLHDLSQACEKASQICQRLNLSCGAAGQGEVYFDINQLIANNLNLLQRAVANPIHFKPDLKSCGTKGDPALLDQVIWNLVLNAAQASMPTKPIEVTTTATPNHTVIRIIDQGVGICPSLQERVFEPFFQGDSSRGHGLGLPIVRAAVESLNGQLEMSSLPDEGTTFEIRLQNEEPPKPDCLSKPSEPTASASSDGRRICLVEDQEALRRLLTNYLRKLEHQVHTVTCAEEMVSPAESFDLLITDVSLPGKNGVELARQMAAENPALRVLFISGYPFEASAVASGSFHWLFLPKPFRLGELSDYLTRLQAL